VRRSTDETASAVLEAHAVRWLRRAPRPEASPTGDSRPDVDDEADDEADDDAFVCSSCGRTDLPPAGDWDPPICQECDAAINFDAILESEYYDDH
jgi:hypothetical protein